MSHRETCHNCGEPATGRHSLPVNDDGGYVPVDDVTTEWAGVPSCEECHALHAAAGDRCGQVLAAFDLAVEAIHARLQEARASVRKLVEAAELCERELNLEV